MEATVLAEDELITIEVAYNMGKIAERERCAKIADRKAEENNCSICDDAREIATEIRKG